jgi:uncharacterized protein (DUF2267 family)
MTVDRSGFVEIVAREARIGPDQAQRAVEATLRTLGERISGGEARDIAEELPDELRPLLADGEDPQGWHFDEFLRRVARREGVTEQEAEGHARAVFAALGLTVSRGELADMASELPKDFMPVLAAAERPYVRGDPAEDVVGQVARRTGLDTRGARRAVDAVLETLGERVNRAQVEDLERVLPPELHPALRRGDRASNGAARPLSLEEFTALVAEREGVSPEQARAHSRSVFAALAGALGERELSDLVAQLPDEYLVLFAG